MHRFNVAWAITAIALLSPALALASDKQTGQQIADALKQSGRLVGFRIGVKYQDGTAWLKGRVSSEEQKTLALELTRQMSEVSQVVDELVVEPAGNAPGPVLRSVGNQRPSKSEGSYDNGPSQRLVAAAPVVHAAKTPRGAAGSLRMAEPTIDPNVQATAGILTFPAPGSQPVSSEPELAPPQPTVQPASAKRTILRRRKPVEEQPASAPTMVTTTRSAPANGPVDMSNFTDNQGRPMKLIPLVRGPDGRLVPMDPAQVPPAAVSQGSAKGSSPARILRRGKPMPIASRNPRARSMPVAYNRQGVAEGEYGAEPVPAMGGVPGAPLPAYGAASHGPVPVGGPAPAYYDQPAVPNYSWPSYAAYPNYAALTYPKQYSPTAWPYIGPFYPYPQVPLGWRKVTLEWDDGWWFLDFDDKNCH